MLPLSHVVFLSIGFGFCNFPLVVISDNTLLVVLFMSYKYGLSNSAFSPLKLSCPFQKRNLLDLLSSLKFCLFVLFCFKYSRS